MVVSNISADHPKGGPYENRKRIDGTAEDSADILEP